MIQLSLALAETPKTLPEPSYYEAEIIPLGPSADGKGQTADEAEWPNGQTHWNIWVTCRNEHTIMEILDIDIPVCLGNLAGRLFNEVCTSIHYCNAKREVLT